MRLILLIFTMTMCCLSANAKYCIEGQLTAEQLEHQGNILELYQTSFENEHMQFESCLVARIKANKQGHYFFEKDLILEKNQIYKIVVRDNNSIDNDKITARYFILSKKDKITFPKNEHLFQGYTNTNAADIEWQQLEVFNHKKETSEIAYEPSLEGYTKDSIQILLVKLIGTKKLLDKRLLEKDIKLHNDYYNNLLVELKESDIAPQDYYYLEHKITLIKLDNTQTKYNYSRGANVLALITICILLWFYLRQFKSTSHSSSTNHHQLSKQEKTIKELIIEGKTNKEIANELYISVSTVKTHITNLFVKTGVKNRKEIIKLANLSGY